MAGVLITLEGIDGCGKSTQARLLKGRLEQEQVPCILVREPGGTVVGEKVRELLLQKEHSLTNGAELLLYMAARAELVELIIRPALCEGVVVICDRYTDSTVAYQGYGAGLDRSWIDTLNEKATGGLRPRLTLLLDLSVEEAAKRRIGSGDRIEEKEDSFHRQVQLGYLDLARREPTRVKIISATLAPDEQHRMIWEQVAALLHRLNLLSGEEQR